MASRLEDCSTIVREAIATALKGHEGIANVSLLLSEGQQTPLKQKILHSFFLDLVKTVQSCTDARHKVRIQLARERALKKFHQIRLNSLPFLWKKVFTDLGVEEERQVVLQSINRLLFNAILLRDFSSTYATSTAEPAKKPSMCSEEENAVRYASGYVVRTLKRHYEKDKSSTPKARQFIECLTNMSGQGGGEVESSYYNYTKIWVESVNRGGLFEVNNNAFLFFRTLELSIQSSLSDHLTSGKMTKDQYIATLTSIDNDLHTHWAELSTDIDDSDDSDGLLRVIVEKWVTMRGFALVSSWLQDYKAITSEKTKNKKALRKTLAAGSSES